MIAILCLALSFNFVQSASQIQESARRVLHRNCVSCHGEQRMSGLDLRHRETMLEGGGKGPALLPGKAEESLLFLAASHDGELKMPPGKPPLPSKDLDTLRDWIDGGAPWESTISAAAPSEPTWWSLRQPRRSAVPTVRNQKRVRNPIDAFILEKLESQGLEPAPEADKRTLIRRASFDLTGLPPTPEQVARFLQDTSPNAYDTLVRDLLDSPRYGERWGRHWLDLVRYADSGGYETDEYFPNSWRYRDYVIKSLNENKPYDRFLQEQIAGDELWPDDLELHDNYYGISPEKLEHLEARIGTGLYTFGPEIVESLLDAPKLAYERMTDWVDTTGAVFMGLTLACARCHDHKFDPVSQRDYFRLQAVFAASDATEIPVVTRMSRFHRNETYSRMIAVDEARRAYKLYLDGIKKRMIAAAKSEFPPEVISAHEVPDEKKTPQQAELAAPLDKALRAVNKDWEDRMTPQEKLEKKRLLEEMGNLVVLLPEVDASHLVKFDGLYDVPKASVLGHREVELIPEVHVLERGELSRRLERVTPGVPAVFDYLGEWDGWQTSSSESPIPRARRHLALWLSRPDHPLTARVMVNRLWQWHFGQGIVRTSNDYGVQGEPPTHPELLDWLALEFVERGWDIKSMHRLIMSSGAYRMASRYSNLRNSELDPENRALWRMNRRRLEAEVMWDTLHSVAGTLNLKMGGRPAVPPLTDEELDVLPAPFLWPVSADPAEHTRRGIYILSRRSFTFPMFRTFDRPDSSLSCPRRQVTTVAPQALWFLNHRVGLQQARKLAERLVTGHGDNPAAWVENAWRIALSRPPTAEEEHEALALFKALSGEEPASKDEVAVPAGLSSIGRARAAALTQLCLTIFNLNEFVYID